MRKQLRTWKQHWTEHDPLHLRVWMLLLFPIFTVLNTELNQMQDLGKLWEFLTVRTGIFLFDILYVGMFFAAFLLLTRRSFAAALMVSVPLYILSCVEYLKYAASNTHFMISDLVMTANAGDIAGLATFDITPTLVLCCLFLLGSLFVMWMGNVHLTLLRRRFASGMAVLVLAANATVIVSPDVAASLFRAAGIDDGEAVSSFAMNEQFQENNFIASLVKGSEDEVRKNVETPERYSRSLIEQWPMKGRQETDGVKPNVVVVMSESYADMRRMQQWDDANLLQVPDAPYAHFDALRQEGFAGECVVPTFGGYTTRTEFELTMGLPVHSMNDLTVPHMKLKDRPQLSVAQAFRDNGYATYYMHPFSGTFYGREDTFEQYGFDAMQFEDRLTVPGDDSQYYHRYVKDEVLFAHILTMLKQQKRPVYIHATSMQNHQPYQDEGEQDQLQYYLDGIACTDEALGKFTDALRQLDEPTILLFVGDHYPFFVGEESIYNQLNIHSENCASLYVQPYLLWSNVEMDFAQMPTQKVSAFYLPWLVRQQLGLSATALEQKILAQMEQTPIYTQPYHQPEPNEALDTLTYDVSMGEQYVKDMSPQ